MHPKRIKGVAYSLLKAVEAWCPFRLPGFRPFPRPYLQALQAIPPDAPLLIFGIENIKDLRILRKYLRTRRVAVFTWNPVIDYQQNHQLRKLHIRQLKGLIFTSTPLTRARCAAIWAEADTTGIPVRMPCARQRPRNGTSTFWGRTKTVLPPCAPWAKSGKAWACARVCAWCPSPAPATRQPQRSKSCRTASTTPRTSRTSTARAACWRSPRPTRAGLTVRCLEALFFDKKLITNNPSVRTLPFYHPARFFILGQDDPQTIPAFLSTPMPPLPKGALDAYDFAHWLRQFEGVPAR